jgi:hypothetical protein
MVGYSRRGELPETVEVWSDDDGGKLQFQGGMAPIPDLRRLTSSEGSSGPHDALSARGPWNRVARCKGDPKLEAWAGAQFLPVDAKRSLWGWAEVV